jgi:pyruvate formate lyase activating enzyme
LLQIKGLQKTTLIDYPGKIACTVFLAGCNFRCGFCYNRNLVLDYDKMESISIDEFFSFLDRRKGKLDGVVICGGEPCFSDGLIEFISKIKEKGYSVKLDTNGSFPDVLLKLINDKLIDYVAMDIKYYPFSKYGKFENKIKESIKLIINSGVEHEFRTTVVPNVLGKEDIINIAKSLQGAKRYYLQQFRNEGCINKDFEKIKPYTKDEMEDFYNSIKEYFDKCSLRNI